MRKSFFSGMAAAALLFALTLGACQNPASESSGDGLRATLSGVVYDNLTGLPLEGATVEIESGRSAKTDKSGTYKFDNLPLGTYNVIISKDNYLPAKSAAIDLDVDTAKDYDGFLTTYTLEKVLQALDDYAKKTDSGGGGNWSYTEGGVFISGDGTAVTVNPQTYEITPFKADGGYKFGYSVALTALAPLTGYLEGTIKLVKTPFGNNGAELKNAKLEEAVAISKDVDVWAVTTAAAGLAPSGVTFGPVKTDDKGGFKFDKLPVGVALTIQANGFTTDDGYYFEPKAAARTYDYGTNEFISVASITALNNGTAVEKTAAQTYTHYDVFYLFTVGSYALVTANASGSPDAPLSPAGTVELTFSKEIDASTFTAVLKPETSSNMKNPGGSTPLTNNIALKATWAGDKKSVTLAPAVAPTGYLKAAFPYSVNGAKPLGRLSITGKAADGSNIFADTTTAAGTTGIPVYVEEGLKLLDVETVAAPARAAVKTSEAIKLTFTKALAQSPVSVTLGSKTPDYKVEGASLYVYADQISTTAVNQSLAYTVSSAADPQIDQATDTSDGFTTTFEYAEGNQILALASITGPDYVGSGYQAAGSNFPTNGVITLKFTRSIPAGSIVKAALVSSANAPSAFPSSNLIPLNYSEKGTAIATATDTLAIDPLITLNYNGTYYLALEIRKDGELIFGNDQIGYYSGILLASEGSIYKTIAFQTVEDTRYVTGSVNAYGMSGGSVNP